MSEGRVARSLANTGITSRFAMNRERREGQMQGRQAVELFLSFEKDTIIQRAVFDGEGKVAGLVFRPTSLAVLPPSRVRNK